MQLGIVFAAQVGIALAYLLNGAYFARRFHPPVERRTMLVAQGSAGLFFVLCAGTHLEMAYHLFTRTAAKWQWSWHMTLIHVPQATAGLAFAYVAFTRLADLRMTTEQEQQDAIFRGAVMDNSVASIIVVDETFTIVDWNATATRTFGWTKLEAIGQSLDLIVPLAWQQLCHQAFQRLLDGEGGKLQGRSVQVTGRKRGDDDIPLELSIVALTAASGEQRFVGFARDLTAKRKVEDRYQQLLAANMQAEVNERHRIADELHDDVVQVMVASLLRLDMVKMGSPSPNKSLDHAIETLRSATDRTRMLMFDLHGQSLADGGLCRALHELVNHEDYQQFDSTVTCPGGRYDPLIEELVFRSVREALVNARKHSRAKRVRVDVREHEGRLEVTVSDDGVGFAANGFSFGSNRRHDYHRGLVGVSERVDACGGRMDVFSAPGIGCTIFFAVPLVPGQSLPMVPPLRLEEGTVADALLPELRGAGSRTGK